MSQRFIEFVGIGVTIVASWSIVGVLIALAAGDVNSAWLFLGGIAGSAVTLVALILFEERQ